MSKNKEIEHVMPEYRSGCVGTGNDKTNEIINCLNDIVARVAALEEQVKAFGKVAVLMLPDRRADIAEERIKALEHIVARRIVKNVNS